MHRRSDPPPELLRLAEHQALMLSCEQAAAFGLTPNPIARLVRTGQWQRPTPGLLYTRPDAPPWLALAWGGVLLGGDQARLAGRAAAYLHSLLTEPPAEIEIKVPLDRARVATWPWTFKREHPGVRLPSRGDPPRLSVEDVVLDSCAGATETEVINLATVAVQGRSTTVAHLRRRLQQRARVSHRRLLNALLADVGAGAETPLELRYLNRVERAHGLPNGRRQASNRAGHSRDVRYDRYSTVVELDGRLGHDGLGRFRDMRRDNYATVHREATLRYGSSDIYGRPCEVAWQVGSVLVDRGWGGLGDPMPRLRGCYGVRLGLTAINVWISHPTTSSELTHNACDPTVAGFNAASAEESGAIPERSRHCDLARAVSCSVRKSGHLPAVGPQRGRPD